MYIPIGRRTEHSRFLCAAKIGFPMPRLANSVSCRPSCRICSTYEIHVYTIKQSSIYSWVFFVDERRLGIVQQLSIYQKKNATFQCLMLQHRDIRGCPVDEIRTEYVSCAPDVRCWFLKENSERFQRLNLLRYPLVNGSAHFFRIYNRGFLRFKKTKLKNKQTCSIG